MSKPEDQLALELSCPICLQLYSDPVVLPCGHSYCQACICRTAYTTEKSAQRLPRCPECREEFQGLETLQKNFKLSSIVEGYRATTAQLYRQPETEPEGTTVFCDHCVDERTPAMKTCVKCEASLCSRHLEKHNEKELFRRHAMLEPQTGLWVKGCVIHRRPLEYFCSTDMATMCTMCIGEGQHQDHDVLTISIAEGEIRRTLENRSKVISSRLLITESLLQKTTEEQAACEAMRGKLDHKALTLVDSMAVQVGRYKEQLHVLLEQEKNQRKKQWQFELSEVEEKQQQLLEAQHGITEALSEADSCSFILRFIQIEQKLREAVTLDIPSTIPTKAQLDINNLQAVNTPNFRSEMTRLLCSLHILLNPLDLSFNLCTAHPSLMVSTDLRTVMYSSTKQPYAEHPERFTTAPQALCSQGFSSGEHVWAVKVGPNSMWSLGACYKSIPRRGDQSRLGNNRMSWRLQWKNGKLSACQASYNVALMGEITTCLQKIEMVLNYEAGTLTFHSINGEKEHVYTFRTVFREAVYPAFGIHSNTPDSWIALDSEM